jgi:hypothetical protein
LLEKSSTCILHTKSSPPDLLISQNQNHVTFDRRDIPNITKSNHKHKEAPISYYGDYPHSATTGCYHYNLAALNSHFLLQEQPN